MQRRVPKSKMEESATQPVIPRPLRYATVFDAIAGRITTVSLRDRPSASKPSKVRDIHNTHLPAVSPQLHLSRHRHVPDLLPDFTSRHDRNSYCAHRSLYPGDLNANRATELPDSNLLRDVHAYVADFYGALNRKNTDEYLSEMARKPSALPIHQGTAWRSMDETALLAFGILLEEIADGLLSHTGESAFVEDGIEALNKDRGIASDVEIGQRIGRSVSRSQSRCGRNDRDSASRSRCRPPKRKVGMGGRGEGAGRKSSRDSSKINVMREGIEARPRSVNLSGQRNESAGSWGGKREGSGRPRGTKRKRVELND